jgi:hypothetical protein
MLDDESFIIHSKHAPADFTRSRVLTFRTVAVLLMAKGSRSLQLALNEFIPKLGTSASTVSKVAYSKARRKLKHTAFITLNQEAVVRTMYEDGDYETLHGFRILAIDGSTVMLPDNTGTRKVFGTVAYRNQKPDVAGEHCYGLASVLYDVLNRVALDARLEPIHSSETELAEQQMQHMTKNDLGIYDRGYCSFRILAAASKADGHFLVRCKRGSFKVASDMLSGKGPDDVVTELVSRTDSEQKLTVRFVRVTLNTGEYEVLATSLTNQQKYPAAIFKELYYCRWGIETFYGVLKTRLNLENFSGHSVEAVLQDFHAAVFLTGAETILTEDTEESLKKQHGGQPKKVNKAVSFNAIKYRAFELFYSKEPEEQVLAELEQLFKQSPTLVRKDKKPARKQTATRQLLGFWKRQRKMVF